MLLKDIASIEFSLPVADSGNAVYGKWLNGSCLLQANIIETIEATNSFKEKTIIKASRNDLLLKRVSPIYVNVYESEEDVYLGGNIIRIRPNNGVNPYFVAMIIENCLPEINNSSNKGTALHAINRQVLENIQLPDIDKESQFKYGEIYRLSNNKEQLIKQLLEKEQLKSKTLKNKVMSKIGGVL